MTNIKKQAVWWMLTIPHRYFTPYQPPQVKYIKGQLEIGKNESKQLSNTSSTVQAETVESSASDSEDSELSDGDDGGSSLVGTGEQLTQSDHSLNDMGESDGQMRTPGYLHWQVFVAFRRSVRLSTVKQVFGSPVHAEPAVAKAARDYVWKDDTAVLGTRFELGGESGGRNTTIDWDHVWRSAISGDFDSIPASVRLRSYRTICAVRNDHAGFATEPPRVQVYWGESGVGKSRRAWDEAGQDAYSKDETLWWDGYTGQRQVVMDDFDGTQVPITTLLKWLDRYKIRLQIKGGYVNKQYDSLWITSNFHPEEWYKCSPVQLRALLRRITVLEEIK